MRFWYEFRQNADRKPVHMARYVAILADRSERGGMKKGAMVARRLDDEGLLYATRFVDGELDDDGTLRSDLGRRRRILRHVPENGLFCSGMAGGAILTLPALDYGQCGRANFWG